MRNGVDVLKHHRPEVGRAVDDALAAAAAAVPDGLLDLCRTRIRVLLGGEVMSDDPRLCAVADYARSELFDDTERLALEFTEQYVLDVANTPETLVAELRERWGNEGLYAFVMGLYAVDQVERLTLSAAIHPAAT